MTFISRSISAAAIAATTLAASLLPGTVVAQDGFTSNLDASLRLGLGIESEPNFDIGLKNFGSRLRWGASADINDSSKLVSYLEFGFDQVSGVFTTRQAWAGVSAGFGTVTGGKQYTAFYDAVTSKVDVAYWGSCFIELKCAREPAILKYTMAEGSDFQLLASIGLATSDPADSELAPTSIGINNVTIVTGGDSAFDDDRDIIDSLDVAANLNAGSLDLSGGIIYKAANNGSKRGFGFGVAAATEVGQGTASASFQFASDDFRGGEDNGFGITTTYQANNFYGLFGISKAENTPFFLTGGYILPIVEDRGLVYFEVGLLDSDEQGSDTEFQARSVLIFNFGASSESGA